MKYVIHHKYKLFFLSLLSFFNFNLEAMRNSECNLGFLTSSKKCENNNFLFNSTIFLIDGINSKWNEFQENFLNNEIETAIENQHGCSIVFNGPKESLEDFLKNNKNLEKNLSFFNFYHIEKKFFGGMKLQKYNKDKNSFDEIKCLTVVNIDKKFMDNMLLIVRSFKDPMFEKINDEHLKYLFELIYLRLVEKTDLYQKHKKGSINTNLIYVNPKKDQKYLARELNFNIEGNIQFINGKPIITPLINTCKEDIAIKFNVDLKFKLEEKKSIEHYN
jgi:hypothetical protein